MLGAGVAGAIRRKGGPSIQEECNQHGPVSIGEAAITGAGNLPATYVIHAASMGLGGRTTEASLRSSTRMTLELSKEHGCETIAFPAIGTGVAGFPLRRCAEVMLEEVDKHLAGGTTLKEVTFVLFDEAATTAFAEVLAERRGAA